MLSFKQMIGTMWTHAYLKHMAPANVARFVHEINLRLALWALNINHVYTELPSLIWSLCVAEVPTAEISLVT